MTAPGDLERRYRRWLRSYPGTFRREYEAEILGVLLDRAEETGRGPTIADLLDLALEGFRMRVRRPRPRDRRGWTPVRLMYLGAALEVVAALTILATAADVRSVLARQWPGLTGPGGEALVAAHLVPVAMAGGVAALCWLVLAWAIGRGRRSARAAFALFLGVNLYGLVAGLAQGSATYAPADLVAGVALCLVHLLAVVLVFRGQAAPVAGRAAAHRVAGRPG